MIPPRFGRATTRCRLCDLLARTRGRERSDHIGCTGQKLLFRETEETKAAGESALNKSNTIVRENIVRFDEVSEIEAVLALFEPANDTVKISTQTINTTNDEAEIPRRKSIEELVEPIG